MGGCAISSISALAAVLLAAPSRTPIRRRRFRSRSCRRWRRARCCASVRPPEPERRQGITASAPPTYASSWSSPAASCRCAATASPARVSASAAGTRRSRCTSRPTRSTTRPGCATTASPAPTSRCWPTRRQPGTSQLPAGVVQINRENYMMVTTAKDLRPQTSRLVKADPAQGNWPTVPDSSVTARYEGGRQSQISGYYDPIPTAGFADRLGVHRRQQLRPHRPGGAVPRQAARRSPTAPAGRAGRRAGGGWGKPPTPLWPDRIGEMSVRQIDGKTVLSYFNASTGNMEVRVADDPTGLGTAPVTTVVFAGDMARSRRGPAAARRTTGWPSRTAATSRRARRSTSCACSSASGTPCRARQAPYRVIQFAVNPFKP